MIKKIDRFIILMEKKFSELLLLFIVAFVFIAASLRWFGYPLVWSVDLAQLLFVWICFVGADLALQAERHIGVDFFAKRFPAKVYKIILFFSYLLIIGFLIIIAYYGTSLAIMNHKRQFSGMEFSYSWATSSAPFGCLLMIRTSIKKIYYLMADKNDPDAVKSNECSNNNTIY